MAPISNDPIPQEYRVAVHRGRLSRVIVALRNAREQSEALDIIHNIRDLVGSSSLTKELREHEQELTAILDRHDAATGLGDDYPDATTTVRRL